MVTILEALQNAKHNLIEGKTSINITVGKQQLNNAVTLLEKGYSLSDDIEELMCDHANVEDVPEK